ncbi:class I SAM-dependent methyltransferase [Achromobacter insuavis]
MSFTNTPGASDDYAERVARHVPGLRDLHRMIGLLMAEQAPDDGRLLVLGAGGGLELRTLAETRPGWRLDGVDPSADMLRQATATLGDLAPRAALHQGYIDDAPEGPFDGATCLLTLHFLPPPNASGPSGGSRAASAPARRSSSPTTAFRSNVATPGWRATRPSWWRPACPPNRRAAACRQCGKNCPCWRPKPMRPCCAGRFHRRRIVLRGADVQGLGLPQGMTRG